VSAPADPESSPSRRDFPRAAIVVLVLFFAAAATLVLVTKAQDRHETRLLSGTFTVFGDNLNKSCVGPAGYADISTMTAVVVKNPQGHTVAQDGLGQGVLVKAVSACRYSFEIPVPSGSDYYDVSIGKRGEAQVSWADIDLPCAIDISVGAPDPAKGAGAAVTCRPSAMVEFIAPDAGVAGHTGDVDDDPGWYDNITLRVNTRVKGKKLWLLRRDGNGDTWVENRLSEQQTDQTLNGQYLFGPNDRGQHGTLMVVAVSSSTDRHYDDASDAALPSPVSMRGTKVLASRTFTCCAE
jgi:hypothetical protein